MQFMCALAAVALASSAAATPAEQAQERLEEARSALSSGRSDDALRLFREVVVLDRSNAAAHNALGSLLNRSGHYAEALPHAEAAVRLDPGNGRYRYNRGVVRAEHGLFAEAIADFDAALAAHPDLTYAWLERGAAKLSLNDAAGAAEDWRQAARTDPKLIWPHWYKATGDFLAGRYADAATGFDRVAEAESGFVPARLWQFAAQTKLGKLFTVPDPQSRDWPAPILRFLRGELSDADLLHAAREDRISGDQRRLGEAYYFIGLSALGRNDRRAAAEAFQRALAVRAPRHVWKMVAEQELARVQS